MNIYLYASCCVAVRLFNATQQLRRLRTMEIESHIVGPGVLSLLEDYHVCLYAYASCHIPLVTSKCLILAKCTRAAVSRMGGEEKVQWIPACWRAPVATGKSCRNCVSCAMACHIALEFDFLQVGCMPTHIPTGSQHTRWLTTPMLASLWSQVGEVLRGWAAGLRHCQDGNLEWLTRCWSMRKAIGYDWMLSECPWFFNLHPIQ